MTAIAHAHTPARWWHLADNGKVVCTLCPRHCHIPGGSRGFCFVRANVDNKLELTTYGRSSGFCIDPVEKKPLNHFLPGTPTLSFGTAGCNLGCKFCQNWDISKSREMDTLAQYASPEAIVAAALRSDCRSLSFTYNDPVIWAEYAIDIAKLARQHGIKTIAVTAGYIDPAAREEFYSHMDAANVDLKGFTEDFYDRLCQSKLAPVLDTLKYLKRETNVWFELTNLMIPGENDSEDETKQMCDWIFSNIGPDVPIHFTAFHPDFKMRETPPTPPATLVRARRIAKAAGIRYAYVGNINDVENQSTYCHACGELLIQRDWYKLGIYRLKGGNCGACGAAIPGVFDEKGAGTWGPKRQRIEISEEKMQGTLDAPKLQTEFSAQQDAVILAFTRAVIEATLTSQPFLKMRLPDSLAKVPAYGVFVSLFRGETLRSCKGQLGEIRPLGDLLAACARDALSQDPRFPRVMPDEYANLTVEVSLLQPPETIKARGDDRVSAVEVGKHGLIIAHPSGQGLLLPHVATEAGWDARTFLENVCRKANLAGGAWREDAATLMTFSARKIESPSQTVGVAPQIIDQKGFAQLAAAAEQIMRGAALPTDAAQSPALRQVNSETLGIGLRSASGLTGLSIAPGQSLLALTQSAAQSLAAQLKQHGRVEPLQDLLFFWQPLPLVAADYPGRHQHLAGAAVLAQFGGQWSLQVGQPGSDPIAGALNGIKLTHRQWLDDRAGAIQVMAFSVFHCRLQSGAAVNEQIRPASCAGGFYPGDAAQVAREVDRYLAAGGYKQIAPQKFRAIMLPHAGWQFCASILGKTLAGVSLPQTVIILGPHHTPYGASCSVAGQSAWQIPGASVPVATDLAQRLSRAVPKLVLETEAHRQEHGSEVLLPFLHYMRPDLKIVPIVLGRCPQETVQALARELAAIVADAKSEPPLLIISSDMNHFASDAENRRLDKLALDAMLTGDPQRLFDTCTKNQISMCGLIPAAIVMMALKTLTPALEPRLIDYTTSAAASGDMSRVVGYAGVVIK